MPFADVQVSPRPLPPGRVRRSSSKPQLIPTGSPFNGRAPPPYSPLANGPIQRSRTPDLLEQLTDVIGDQNSTNSLKHTESSSHELSKEELEGLLLRAGNIIREREEELDSTSRTCKTLSESNATLKARNDAFLARLPSSNPSSPISSPPQSYASLASLSHSTSSASDSPPADLSLPPQTATGGRRRPGHMRKPSTPAELAALADQNAHLLSKVQELESDAARTEQAGKKKLRALERDIGILKEELDKTRVLGERLEESLQSQGSGSGGKTDRKGGLPAEMEKELVKAWKRLTREAKVNEMRAKTRPWEVEGEMTEPKDFAPSNPLFAAARTWTPDKRPSLANEAVSSSSLSHESAEPGPGPKESADPDDPFASFSPPPVDATEPLLPSAVATLSPGRERAIVAQLLVKIAELEETNTSLVEEHRAAQARSRDAQRETDGVRALCEFINEEIELEIIDVKEEEVGESGDGRPELRGLGNRRPESTPRRTIRLRSLGRKSSLNFDSPGQDRPVNEAKLRKFSSMDNLASNSSRNKSWNSRDQIPSQEVQPLLVRDRPGVRPRRSVPRMRKSVRGLFESESLSSADSGLNASSSSRSLGLPGIDERPISPDREQAEAEAEAFLSLQIINPQSVGDVHDASYRSMDENCPPSLESELRDEVDLGLTPNMTHMRSNSVLELLNKTENEPGSASGSPPLHVPNLRLSPSVPGRGTDRFGATTEGISEVLDTPRAESVRARFADDDLCMRTASSLNEEDMFPRLRRAKSSILASRSSLFEVQTQPVEPERRPAQPSTAGTSENASAEKRERKQRTKTTALLIELWLWLQFAVVIVVFLFAMARMGPRTFFRKSKVTSQRANT